MKKFALVASAAILPFVFSGAAHAQGVPLVDPYIGAQIGHHDLGLPIEESEGFDIDDSDLFYGVYAGVDVNVGPATIVGVEGNLNLANGPIDTEFGLAGRVGFKVAGSVIFARAGYQWVNVDAEGLLDIDEDIIDDDDLDIDDTVGDFLVGAGVDFALGGTMGVRAAVDTVGFDSLRPTIGLHFRF